VGYCSKDRVSSRDRQRDGTWVGIPFELLCLVATLLQDGQVEVDGEAFPSASDAASAIVGKRTNGWWFFLTDQASRQSLQRVRRDYVNAMAVDVEDDEADDDEDEE
jgi:hypothetical protein